MHRYQIIKDTCAAIVLLAVAYVAALWVVALWP